MTPELQDRWKSERAPFDGMTVVGRDEPDLNVLLAVLSFACSVLQSDYPTISVFPDWHEHDGFVLKPKRGDWATVLASLANTRALYESRDSDDSVRVAIFPESFEWLLRYNIDDDETNDHLSAWCDFDFTCTPGASVADLVHELHAKWPEHTNVSYAKSFFNESYGG